MKKALYAVAVIATIAIAGWNYQQNKQSVELSDLALENVEALARNEWGDEHCKGCSPSTSSICWMSEYDGCMGYRIGTAV